MNRAHLGIAPAGTVTTRMAVEVGVARLQAPVVPPFAGDAA